MNLAMSRQVMFHGVRYGGGPSFTLQSILSCHFEARRARDVRITLSSCGNATWLPSFSHPFHPIFLLIHSSNRAVLRRNCYAQLFSSGKDAGDPVIVEVSMHVEQEDGTPRRSVNRMCV